MELNGARVLVTGGSKGIGKATARLLVEKGASVAICARNGDRLHATAQEVGAHAIEADVSRADHAELLIEESVAGLGGLDAVVNNAAIGTFAKLLDTAPEDVERVFRVNVLGALLVAKAAARVFVDQGSGTIVNVGSTASRKGFPGGSAYAASKFALTGLTECWRAELREHGVRVMQVNPSEVQTGFGRDEGPEFNPTKLQSDDIADVIVAMLAMSDRGFITETTIWATNPK